MSGKFYVYEHWRTDKNECFYVGKGYGRRAYNIKQSRNRFHRFIVDKLERIGASVEVRIVIKNLTEIQAFSEETKRIKFWKNDGSVLANLTEGGEGFSGGRHSEEWKNALSKRAAALWLDVESREKMIANMIGKKRTAEQKENYKGPKSEAHVDAIRAAAKNRKRPIPRTDAHRKNASEALKIAIPIMWQKRKSDPAYIAAQEANRARIADEKNRRIEKEHFEAAQLRFNQFVFSLIDGTERRCTKCRMAKAPEQFTRTNQGPTGLSYICKPCCAKNQQEMRDAKRLLQGSN